MLGLHGMVWAIIHPMFLMGLYVFIFSFVFKQKTWGTVELPLDEAAYLLSCLRWLGFQEALSKSCVTIKEQCKSSQASGFPTGDLPLKTVIASLFPLLISLFV